MTSVIRFSLRFRGVIIALFCLLIGYGILDLSRAKLDVFPEFAPPLVVLQTEAPGFSPHQVELLVTQPLENALGGIIGIRTMASKSTQGLSMITMTFRDGSNTYRNRQIVSEQLGTVRRSLPSGVRPPLLLPLTSSTANVLTIGITSRTRSLMSLRMMADWTLKPQILGIPGVSGIGVVGGEIRQLQIQIHPSILSHEGLSISDVARIARRATGVRGGGVIDTPNQRFILSLKGAPMTPEALSRVVLARHQGAEILLGDVAHVAYGPEPPVGAASIGGVPGVVLMVKEQFGADTMSVTRALDRRLRILSPLFSEEGVTLHEDLFRPAKFVSASIHHLKVVMLVGAFLVILVLLLFLLDFRAALISSLAIPISLLSGIIILENLGITLNTMTLGGLAIAIGEVVDDAIVDVENILRRLRENILLEHPLSKFHVIFKASLEIRRSMIFATLAVIVAFFPVLTLPGVSGKLFAPLGISYVAAIAASLVVALTLTPALTYLLFRTHRLSAEPLFLTAMKTRYSTVLAPIIHKEKMAVVSVIVLGSVVVIAFPLFGRNLVPTLKEGHYIIHMRTLPGTSLSESLRLGALVTQAVSGISGVKAVSQRTGRSTLVGDLVGTYSSEFDVDLKAHARQRRTLSQIYQNLDRFAGASFKVNTFLSERIHETVSMFNSPVVINLYGHHLDLLDRKAQEVAAVLQGVNGARGVQIQAPIGNPRFEVRLRQSDLTRWGIDPVSALDTIQTAYQGQTSGQIYEGNRAFDVTVVLDPVIRKNPFAVGDLLLKNAEGRLIPLRDVADISESSGRFIILHREAQRLQTVTSLISGNSLTSFVAEAEHRIRSQVHFPPGISMVFEGDIEEQSRLSRDLLEKGLLSVAGVILLLFIALGSLRSVLLVLLNLPFSLSGGVIIVLMEGGVLSIGSLVGFVTLFGITLRNSLMLISHYNTLIQEEGAVWNRETAIRGARERLTPILMTSLVTAAGMVPLVMTSGAPGNELDGPMAMVVLGGLVTSTSFNLLIMPTLACRFGRFDISAGEPEID